MKILHIAYIYPPRVDVADGITRVIYDVSKEQVKRGHEVTVFALNILDLYVTNQYVPVIP
jgi:hypothetical protein